MKNIKNTFNDKAMDEKLRLAGESFAEAACHGDVHKMRAILKVHPKAYRGEYIQSPLANAILGGHENVVKFMYEESGATADELKAMQYINEHAGSVKKRLLIERLCIDGKADILDLLLRYDNSDVDRKINNSIPILVTSIHINSPATALTLLKHGANPDVFADSTGETPLHAAVRYFELDDLKKLFPYVKGQINSELHPLLGSSGDTDYHSPLMYYISTTKPPKLDTVRFLVENGADINFETQISGRPLFIAAARVDHPEILEYLLQQGMDAKAISSYGSNACHFVPAGFEEYMPAIHMPENLELLAAAGVNFDLPNKGHKTPLILAIEKNQKMLAMQLAGKGADLHRKDPHTGKTPLSHAPSELAEALLFAVEKRKERLRERAIRMAQQGIPRKVPLIRKIHTKNK